VVAAEVVAPPPLPSEREKQRGGVGASVAAAFSLAVGASVAAVFSMANMPGCRGGVA